MYIVTEKVRIYVFFMNNRQLYGPFVKYHNTQVYVALFPLIYLNYYCCEW